MRTAQELVGTNLKYYRYKSGLSQEKFYGQLGINSKYYASIERGEINVTVGFLDKLAKVLQIDIREFFNPAIDRVINQKRIDAKGDKKED